MSMTKVKTNTHASKATEIENMLATAAVESVALNQLIPSGLNVRRREPDADKISELAGSIVAVGVLQNLVVIPDKGGKWAVVAGSRRLLALRQLQANGQLAEDVTVPVKKVSAELGVLVSLTENTQREAMHPSEQLAVFRTLSESGKSAAEIGGLLGYTTRHVQKLLKLARVHTELLNALARDEINVDQLQALASCDDTERQWQVWLQGEHQYNGREPRLLRNRVLNDEVCADDNAMLAFVGMDAYTSEGGEIRHDLFTDAGYLRHPSLLDALVIEKVANLALHLAEHEGWSWSEGRLQSVKRWGEDSERYRLLAAPEVCDEEATGALEDALDAVCLEIESCEDRGEETSDTLRLLWKKQVSTEDLLRERRSAVQMRAWSEEVKASAGVVVSFDNGAIKVQRGIMRTDDDVSANTRTVDNHASNAAENAVAIDKPSQCTMYSAALLRSLTAERTLAVQAALAKNPDVALVFLVHTLLLQFFGKQRSDILRVNVENKRTELLTNIGGQAETSKAIIALTECENEVIQRLPDNWQEDSSFLLGWSQEALINLLALCVSCGIDGVTDKIDNHGKASDKLSVLESALDFSLSDWWQPDSDNFFSRISKASISECLKNSGHETEAKQALTLKKSDAAQLAAQTVNDTVWLPDCLMPLSTVNTDPILTHPAKVKLAHPL